MKVLLPAHVTRQVVGVPTCQQSPFAMLGVSAANATTGPANQAKLSNRLAEAGMNFDAAD
ncbi:MAG: hypothetical protein AUG51_02370 [Acidobacteria bacterium 13_1_20CM_3_53_8]|nr:MAG: hypothetical protein AUG51_02370 [Acidobacteria bacterium 13_1_20CM_3_53_8]